MHFDTIIVGAGSAGAVIAARLSEDPARSILLLEAGPDYADLDSTPADIRNGLWNSLRPHDWRFRAHHTVDGRPQLFPRGRVTGGSSAVNTTIALRGVPEDYDEWARQGNDEWSWEKLLPIFRDIEHDHDFGGDFHGTRGPLPVRRYRTDELVNWQAAFLAGCRELGFALVSDNNDPDSTGAGPHPMNREGTLRISTAISHLATARGRQNLTIRGNTHVRRVLLAPGRVAGVEVELGSHVESLFAHQIVLCAGAIQSPALLLRSAIGGHQLARLGLPMAVELPGVGEHLLDHPTAGVAFLPVEGACRTDVPSVQVTRRYTASGSALRNDMQVMPVSFVQTPAGPVFSIGACLELPVGVGRLIVESLDPRAQPRIESHFCDEPEDLRRMVEGVHIALQLGETEAVARLHRGILRPRAYHLAGDESLGAWIRLVAGSGYHPCGTAKMGPASDPQSVVDQYGQVHGVEGLYVADASIMPAIPRANTNFTSIVIGERIGAWLRDRPPAAPAHRRSAVPHAPGQEHASSHATFNGTRLGDGHAVNSSGVTGGLLAPAVSNELGDASGPDLLAPLTWRLCSPFSLARDRGATYLEARQREDGLVGGLSGGLGGFYKALFALAIAGRTRPAARLAGWMTANACTPDGDYAGAWERGALQQVYPYANAWLTGGLQLAGEYGLASRAMATLAGLQDASSGGLWSDPAQRDSNGRQQVLPTAMTGVAALVSGRHDVATGVARFLRSVANSQPDPEHELWHVYTPASGLIISTPAGRTAEFAVVAAQPLQAYFVLGIGAAFLSQFYAISNDEADLAAARIFLAPAFNATQAMYETAQVGKVAWGAALLARATGEQRYHDLALRATGALLAQQNPDGSWDNTGGFTTDAVRDEVTAEFVVILTEVERGLAGAPPSNLASALRIASPLAQAPAGLRR